MRLPVSVRQPTGAAALAGGDSADTVVAVEDFAEPVVGASSAWTHKATARLDRRTAIVDFMIRAFACALTDIKT